MVNELNIFQKNEIENRSDFIHVQKIAMQLIEHIIM